MSPEQPRDPSQPATDPETVRSLKDRLIAAWDQLPAEHQASMALALVKWVQTGEYGEWFEDATQMLRDSPSGASLGPPRQEKPNAFTMPFEITSVCRADLQEVLSAVDVAQFDDEDMRRLAQKMGDAYVGSGAFWDDLELFAGMILKEKQG